MAWLWTILIFVLTLWVVVKASGGFVHFAAKIARRLGVSEFVIGLTLVAIGTSLPELMNTIISSIKGESGVALGNILGSNMANLGLSIGLSILLASLLIKPELYRRESMLLALGTAIFALLSMDGELSAFDGSLLVMGFIGYVLVVTRAFREFSNLIKPVELQYFVEYVGKLDRHIVEQYRRMQTKKFRRAAFDVIAALGCAFALILGSNYLLESILSMASLLSITSGAVAATIVAIGTTTPELSVTIASVRKGYHDMLFGNIIGSNLVNLLLIMGLGSMIKAITVPYAIIHTILPLLCVVTALLVLILAFNWRVPRPIGAVFVGAYALFLVLVWIA